MDDPGSVPPSATPQSWRAAGGRGSSEASAGGGVACLLDGSGGEGGEGEEGGTAGEDEVEEA